MRQPVSFLSAGRHWSTPQTSPPPSPTSRPVRRAPTTPVRPLRKAFPPITKGWGAMPDEELIQQVVTAVNHLAQDRPSGGVHGDAVVPALHLGNGGALTHPRL